MQKLIAVDQCTTCSNVVKRRMCVR